VEIVHGRERGELAVAQAMPAVMMQRQLADAPFHAGAAALEQIGANAGDLFDPGARRGRETLQRMIGATQRLQQRGTRRLHAVSVVVKEDVASARPFVVSFVAPV
jgi:hypothetical protein